VTAAHWLAMSREARATIERPTRYAHGVRVARLAGRLAARHGLDPVRARTAGLLHDLARCWSSERLLAECEARRIPIDDFSRRNPIVLHAPLGAALAAERCAVDDPGVLDAIRSHTVGGTELAPLAIVVYLADGLEPGRSYPERAELEALAFEDLDRAYDEVLRSTVAALARRGLEVAPQTHAAIAARPHGRTASA